MMDVRSSLVHAVTAFDRKQEEKAKRNPRAYYNTYALAQYLSRVDDICADVDVGADVDKAVMAGFSAGPLRTACLKAVGFNADNKTNLNGSYNGMPVYAPVAK